MHLPIVFLSLFFIAIVVSLLLFMSRLRESKSYEIEYENECERIKSMPHIEPPWYRPPNNNLKFFKALLLISAFIFFVSCLWFFLG